MASFISRLPSFDAHRHYGALSGVMQNVYRDPAVAAFADTLDYGALPANWEDDPHIQQLAFDAWHAPDKYNSPFFRAWFDGSRAVDWRRRPLPLYHGSPNEDITYFNRSVLPGGAPSAVWTEVDPKTGLSYLLRPANPAFLDPLNRAMRTAAMDAFNNGERLHIPDVGRVDYYGFTGGSVPIDYAMDTLWRNMANKDWHSRLEQLDSIYNSKSDTHIPVTALEMVTSNQPQFYEFFDANENILKKYAPHEIIGRDGLLPVYGDKIDLSSPFSNPSLGKIYPLYANSKTPFVLDNDFDKPKSWVETPRMHIYANSLPYYDQFKLRSMGIDVINSHLDSIDKRLAGLPAVPPDYDWISPEDYEKLLKQSQKKLAFQRMDMERGLTTPDNIEVQDFLPEAFSGKGPVTDQLANYLAERGDHDALRTNNVFDGGGGEIPATTTFAVFDPNALKSDENLGTFSPRIKNIYRTLGPAMLGGGALAAAMGRPTGASAAVLPSGWVPPSAKAELEGMEPSGWMDPVNWLVDAATAGGGAAVRAGQAALGAAQDWLGEQVPQIPEIPEEYREAAQ